MGGDELDINSHKGDLWNEVERLRAVEAAARRLLTLDVSEPVARAIALAVIASGLRAALGLDGA